MAITLDEARRTIAAVEQALREGYPPRGVTPPKHGHGAIAIAAERLGSNRHTIDNRVCPGGPVERVFGLKVDWSLWQQPELQQKGEKNAETVARSEREPERSRADIHDADFWRKKCKVLEKELGETEHVVSQLSGLTGIPFSIPTYLNQFSTERSKSVMGALVSDIHMGEVISAEEILGINEFNPDICRQRLRRYFTAVCEIGTRWTADTDCQGALLPLAGDLISGDIHEELRITNALTSHEQVQAVVEECVAGIRYLKEAFGAVHVVGVPGNHGRTTFKPTAKLYSRLSYDMHCISVIAGHFCGDLKVTFQATAAKDQIVPIFGRTVLISHGDKLSTKGGMGFAGPILPIVRGTKKVEAQQASIGRRPDLILHGHYHTTANPGNVLSNGSVPGYSEYSDDLRAVIEAPQQWAFLLHSKWWLRERLPIQLEEPRLPEKPIVRVPASYQHV